MGSKQSKTKGGTEDKAGRGAKRAKSKKKKESNISTPQKKLTKKEKRLKAKEDASRAKAEAQSEAEEERLRKNAIQHRRERRELAKKLGQGISDHSLYEELHDPSLHNVITDQMKSRLRARFDYLIENRDENDMHHNKLVASTLSITEFLSQPEYGHHPLARRYIETVLRARKSEETTSEKFVKDESGKSVTLRLSPEISNEHGITFWGATDTKSGGGACVTFVAPGSLAQEAGIKVNDILTGVTTFRHGHGTFKNVANMPWKKARKLAETQASRTLTFLRQKSEIKKTLKAAALTVSKKERKKKLNAKAKRKSTLARTRSNKSPDFYGVVFSALGSIGLALIQDPSLAPRERKTTLGCIVGEVVHGSAASQNGKIQEGDALVSVNGKSTVDMKIQEIIRYIAKANRPLKLRFHRAHGSGQFGGDGSRNFRYCIKFGEGRIGLALKETNIDQSKMRSFYGRIKHDLTSSERAAAKIGKISVADIIPGTQASMSEKFYSGPIKKGDILVAINNRDVTSMSQKAVMNILSQAGRPVFCQFIRPSTKNLQSTEEEASGPSRVESHRTITEGGVIGKYPEAISSTYKSLSGWYQHASSRITFDDFLAAYCVACHETEPKIRDAVVFRMFDVDGDGMIAYDDLFYTLKMVSQGRLTDINLENFVNRILDKFDATNDTELDIEELRKLIHFDKLLSFF